MSDTKIMLFDADGALLGWYAVHMLAFARVYSRWRVQLMTRNVQDVERALRTAKEINVVAHSGMVVQRAQFAGTRTHSASNYVSAWLDITLRHMHG